jgi:hypothetical protein
VWHLRFHWDDLKPRWQAKSSPASTPLVWADDSRFRIDSKVDPIFITPKKNNKLWIGFSLTINN